MQITIVGGGYVGLVSSACFSECGHSVNLVDTDLDKVQMINDGISPIHEKGLDELLKRNIGQRLHASNSLVEAMSGSDATFVAVGTPFDGTSIDLSAIHHVAYEIGRVLRSLSDYHLVVVKSTVVPGTTDDSIAAILEHESGKRIGADFGLGMNPEFLKEGTAVSDFMTPDRIVIGSNDEKAQSVLSEIYACFPETDRVFVNNTTAEMIKYTSNSLLATLISFANEIGNICTEIEGVDARDVMRGTCLDARISPLDADKQRTVPGITSYLAAGCGFGGSCFPKDVNSLRAYARELQLESALLDAVMHTNENQAHKLVDLLLNVMPDIEGKSISILGLAFKPDTDDTRESASITVIKALESLGACITTFDPVVKALPEELTPLSISVAPSLTLAVQDADAILITTAWDEFKELPALITRLNDNVVVVDGRRILEPTSVKHYHAIGIGKRAPKNSDHNDDADGATVAA